MQHSSNIGDKGYNSLNNSIVKFQGSLDKNEKVIYDQLERNREEINKASKENREELSKSGTKRTFRCIYIGHYSHHQTGTL